MFVELFVEIGIVLWNQAYFTQTWQMVSSVLLDMIKFGWSIKYFNPFKPDELSYLYR